MKTHWKKLVLTLLTLFIPFSTLATPPRPAREVALEISGNKRIYQHLDSATPSTFHVRGPGELKIFTRAWLKSRSDLKLKYGIRVRVNGGLTETIEMEETGLSVTAKFRDRGLGKPGALNQHRIQIGRGYHNIEVLPLRPEAETLLRFSFKKHQAKKRKWAPLDPVSTGQAVDVIVNEGATTYFRHNDLRPFRLEVIGPTELRILTRLDYTPEMRGRIDYRLQIRENGKVINTFQLSTRRSEVASYRSARDLVPSRAIEVSLPISAGRHVLEILPLDPEKAAVLARFSLPKADLIPPPVIAKLP